MIVEDDKDIRETIAEILHIEGYNKVVTAENGLEALEKLKLLDKPAFIILDIKMPKMDGYEFLTQIEKTGQRGVVHVVVLTAIPKTKKLPTAADESLHKPINVAEFLDLVSRNCIKE